MCAIEAYSAGTGPAAVNVSLLRRHPTGFGETDLWSRPGWECLAYPKVTLRATVGRVRERLVAEAKARGARAGEWGLGFSAGADSNGKSWPTGEDAPLITTRVGATYWDVLNQLAESLIDFHSDPGGSKLMAYVKDSSTGGGGVPWQAGVQAESLVVRTSAH